MSFLASWIQQLVLAVILATFLDLLLPSNTMQRYVRLVMGLIILMLILSPLLTLFKSDWDVERFFSEGQAATDKELQSLPNIREKTGDLQNKQEQLVEETVQSRMEQQITKAVEQRFSVSARDVSVKLTDGGGNIGIGEVVLLIAENGEADGKVEPVEPVSIDVGEEQETRETAQTTHTDSSPLIREIREWVAREWHVDEQRIHVDIAEKEG